MVAAYDALDRALILDEMGYVCTPATTLDTTVNECKPVLDENNKPKRTADRKVIKELGPVVKKAKIAIGTWGQSERGKEATTRRFTSQLKRVQQAAQEYSLDQDEGNLGVAIITSKSGIVVLDIDAGKVPDPHDPDQMMDAETAHDLLLGRLLKVSGFPEANIDNLIDQFRQLVHVRTPSGGWHYYFRRQQGQKPRTHTGLISHVDIRAGFQDDDGDWESSGIAYAPGNVTEKGAYIVYEVGEDGHRSRLQTLPPVNDLPFLPNELASLFEKSTTEIRSIADGMGIPIPESSVRSHKLGSKKIGRSVTDADADLSKWNDLVRSFIEKSYMLSEDTHER